MDLDVMPLGPHEFAVTVTEGHQTTSHKVAVPEDLLDAFVPVEEERLVRESVATYLEHGTAAALPQELDLGWIADSVPEFGDEVRARLA